ncbi:hypothetical protein TNCV_196641 [Trichonephila clavipes]|uniref:Uncharacterized protein n=1 Tax=Trichonephila clavipes TaxID=2585209 RepID=A0A8X6WJR7_TRICX|nr:hypothetical protein TNCV_196641 [Trichonephila clavipes]
MSSSPAPPKTRHAEGSMHVKFVELKHLPVGVVRKLGDGVPAQATSLSLDQGSKLRDPSSKALETATAGSDVVQSGRPIFDDFFQHLWPYIGDNTANVVFQMVKRLWLIRIDQ